MHRHGTERGRFLSANVLKRRHYSHATNDIESFNSSKIMEIMLKNEYLIKSIYFICIYCLYSHNAQCTYMHRLPTE